MCDNVKSFCIPQSTRADKDKYGCATKCGNGFIEDSYENCQTCPEDVGQCDNTDCINKDQCMNGFCVHGKCYNQPYKLGDNL